MKATNKRALYTLEFKQEAIRIIQSGAQLYQRSQGARLCQSNT